MKVKICANKSIEEATMCLEAVADIIGVLVGQQHNSPDFVDKGVARKIVEYVNKRCEVALVTHLTVASEIIELSKYIGNDIIQLHSDISESEVEKIVEALPSIKLIRLIHISKEGKICSDFKKMKYADFYLLDSFDLEKKQVGGTGITHDWDASYKLIKELNKPTFLAGGLDSINVEEAIKTAQPYGVDVNSGCKNELGVKDKEKITQFVYNAKNAR